MRNFDFSSWQSVLMTLIGVALFALISIGIRLLMVVTFQQRRERMNRQINERLRTLIAAYKTLGGSFTGDLSVDPTHLRDVNRQVAEGEVERPSSDRSRRIRDAVEAALSDIILLGTEQQVRLASAAVNELVAGRAVHLDELVASLRDFIREVLDLGPIPAGIAIPKQGPTRPSSSGGGRKGEGGKDGGRAGGGGSGMGAGGGMSMGMGGGFDDPPPSR